MIFNQPLDPRDPEQLGDFLTSINWSVWNSVLPYKQDYVDRYRLRIADQLPPDIKPDDLSDESYFYMYLVAKAMCHSSYDMEISEGHYGMDEIINEINVSPVLLAISHDGTDRFCTVTDYMTSGSMITSYEQYQKQLKHYEEMVEDLGNTMKNRIIEDGIHRLYISYMTYIDPNNTFFYQPSWQRRQDDIGLIEDIDEESLSSFNKYFSDFKLD